MVWSKLSLAGRSAFQKLRRATSRRYFVKSGVSINDTKTRPKLLTRYFLSFLWRDILRHDTRCTSARRIHSPKEFQNTQKWPRNKFNKKKKEREEKERRHTLLVIYDTCLQFFFFFFFAAGKSSIESAAFTRETGKAFLTFRPEKSRETRLVWLFRHR